MLTLRACNVQDARQEYDFVHTLPADENGFTNEWCGVSYETFCEKAIPRMMDWAQGRNLPKGFVPETFLFLRDGEMIVGQFRVRHHLCEALRCGAGHIGYCIGKEHRGKGYATQGLRQTLDYARHIVPETEFYLRVNKDNPASLRVMLKNGGRMVGEDEGHFFVRIPNPGKE